MLFLLTKFTHRCCKYNALVLQQCLLVAKRFCYKRQKGFLTLEPLLGFTAPLQSGLQQGSEQAEPAPALHRPLAPALTNLLHNNTRMIASIWLFISRRKPVAITLMGLVTDTLQVKMLGKEWQKTLPRKEQLKCIYFPMWPRLAYFKSQMVWSTKCKIYT